MELREKKKGETLLGIVQGTNITEAAVSKSVKLLNKYSLIEKHTEKDEKVAELLWSS